MTKVKEQIDEKIRQEGFPIELAENVHLRLPFVFPDDGFTCEYLQGIPHGLLEFIEKYIRVIQCRIFLHSASLGYWTEFFSSTNSIETNGDHSHRLETIKLFKKDNSFGLSIVAAKVSRNRFNQRQFSRHFRANHKVAREFTFEKTFRVVQRNPTDVLRQVIKS